MCICIVNLTSAFCVCSWIPLDGQKEHRILFHPCKNVAVGNQSASNECFKGVSVSTQNKGFQAYNKYVILSNELTEL